MIDEVRFAETVGRPSREISDLVHDLYFRLQIVLPTVYFADDQLQPDKTVDSFGWITRVRIPRSFAFTEHVFSQNGHVPGVVNSCCKTLIYYFTCQQTDSLILSRRCRIFFSALNNHAIISVLVA